MSPAATRRGAPWRGRAHAAAALGLAIAVALGLACQPAGEHLTAGEDGGSKPAAECVACHLQDYEGAKNHVGVRPTTCQICHLQGGFHPSVVRHPWPLTGAHEKADCFACHATKPPVFAGTGEACVDCHRDKYDHNPNPWHARFSTACAECHATTAWKPTLPGHHEPEPEPTPPPEPPVPAAALDAGKPKPPPVRRPRPKPPDTVPQPKPPDIVSRPSGRR